jgi:hypothetical protein
MEMKKPGWSLSGSLLKIAAIPQKAVGQWYGSICKFADIRPKTRSPPQAKES